MNISFTSNQKADELLPHSNQIKIEKNEQLYLLHDFFNTILFKYLPNADLLNLSETSRQLRDWTAHERDKRAIFPLLLAVVRGNEKEAKRLLEMNSHLLLSKKGEVIDYSNRLIKDLTPFQAALSWYDVEMCQMIKPYFATLLDGQLEMKSQFDEIFPKGIEAHIEKQKANVFDFSEIIQAIIVAPANEVTAALEKAFDDSLPLHQALEKFRITFTEKTLSEMIFNPYHLLEAFERHDSEFNNFGTGDKRDLFWRQVIGFVQRYLPACMLQAFAQGIHSIVQENEALRRSFEFIHGGNVMLPAMDFSGLGFDFAGHRGWAGLVSRRGGGASFRDYVSSKNTKLEEIHQSCSMVQTRAWCAIS